MGTAYCAQTVPTACHTVPQAHSGTALARLRNSPGKQQARCVPGRHTGKLGRGTAQAHLCYTSPPSDTVIWHAVPQQAHKATHTDTAKTHVRNTQAHCTLKLHGCPGRAHTVPTVCLAVAG